MIYKCRFCENEFDFHNQQKCASHSATCKMNPKMLDGSRGRKLKELANKRNPVSEYHFNCKKCNKEYVLNLKFTNFKKQNYSKHCSYTCSNGKIWTEADKIKKSISAKNSLKVLSNNSSQTFKDKVIQSRKLNVIKNGKKPINEPCLIQFENGVNVKYYNVGICILCEKQILRKSPGNGKYHRNCWMKISGGLKENSVRLNTCMHNGFKMDSGAEKAFAIFLDKHNVNWIKNKTEYFKYVDSVGKSRKYYPDFYLPDYNQWVEIKGKFYADKDPWLDLKINAVPGIKLIFSKQIFHLKIEDIICK